MRLQYPHDVIALYALDNYYTKGVKHEGTAERIRNAMISVEQDRFLNKSDRGIIKTAIYKWIHDACYYPFEKIELLIVIMKLGYGVQRMHVSKSNQQILEKVGVVHIPLRTESIGWENC